MMRIMFLVLAATFGLVMSFGAGWILGQTGVGQSVSPESLSDLESDFVERMENVALVGHFTIEGRDDLGINPERYEIEKVTKVDDSRWRFDARIVYAGIDVTLPVTVPIVWAEDTPMISITDFSIPTLGSFTVRLIFFDDRYAGSWQHGEFGGLMYGSIDRE